MSVRLSCPSCNTGFALGAVPADRRAACPRCGDVFPVRGEVEKSEGGGSGAESQPNPTPATPNPKRGWSGRRAARVAVGLALFAFGVGLAFYFTRGPKQKGEPQPEVPPAATATPPAQLAGVGHLPAECNVVFAVQPGPLLAYAARTNREPRDLLAGAGIPPQVLNALDQVGLPLAQIDHIAAGAFLGNDGDELRLAFALVLKQPLADEDEFLKKLKAKPAAGKKPRFAVDLAKLPLTLARVSPTVWVFGLNDKDFAAVEKGGFGPGGTQFRGSDTDGLRRMLRLVSDDSAVWVVAHDDRDWAQKPLVKLAAQSPEAKKWASALGTFRSGLFSVNFGEQPSMRLRVRNADTASAERLGAIFRANGGEGVLASGDRDVVWDVPFDPATARDKLQKLFADISK